METGKQGRLYQSVMPDGGTVPLTTPRPIRKRDAASLFHSALPNGAAKEVTAFIPRREAMYALA